jgi:long-chain acyl-CoA synthetase
LVEGAHFIKFRRWWEMITFSKQEEAGKNQIEAKLSKTLPQLFKENYERYGNKVVEMRKKNRGIWQSYTWSDSYEKVKGLFYGLEALGFKKEDKACIIGENAPEFHWAEFAILSASGIVAAIYPDALPEEIEYIAGHSESRIAFAEDQEQVDKILKIKNKLPNLLKVIYWDHKGLKNYDDPMLLGFDDLVELGKKSEKEHPGLFDRSIEEGNPDTLAIFSYTSGTSAAPKAAMLSHRKILLSAKTTHEVTPYQAGDDEMSSIPLAWAVEQYLVGVHLLFGTKVNFYEEPETVKEDLRAIAPNFIMYTARLWEAEARLIQAKIADTSALKRFFYNMFLPIGLKMTDLTSEGKEPNLFLKILYRLGYWTLFRPILDELGLTRCRHAQTSGATISPEILRFFRAMGLNIVDVYASTELNIVATSSTGEQKGKIRRGAEVRITEQGEILCRSDTCFLGYYKDPEKTRKALEGGWFHTGDAGFIDDQGRFIFLDRLDALAELVGGIKVAPQFIESRLKFSPYIKDAIVICESKPFVSVIVDLDFDNLTKWAEAKKVPFTTLIQLSQEDHVYELVSQVIKGINGRLPSASAIKRFTNLHKNLDPDEAELTRTRKLRRDLVLKRYDDIVGAIYSNKTEMPVTGVVKYRDGRMGSVTAYLKIKTVEAV